MKKLGINIDHVATLRNARGIDTPSPIAAAILAERAGADNITCHLREDRRHIRDEDVIEIKKLIHVPLNLEMAVTDEMIQFAIEYQPDVVTFVPERRQERTTEGGLDLFANEQKLNQGIQVLIAMGIEVSLFIEPDPKIVEKAQLLGVSSIEIHTGAYAENFGGPKFETELNRIQIAARLAKQMEMFVHAGHGLNRQNIGALALVDEISSFQIGHSIIGDAVFVGMMDAVQQMKKLIHGRIES